MSLGVDVRIHAQRYRRARTHLRRDLVQSLQLRRGFDIETMDADLQRAAQFIRAFADARKHDLVRIAARAQHALELAHRDDVEARTQPRHHAQHAEIGIGLHRITHEVVDIGKRRVEGSPVALDGRARVDITRRAMLRGDLGQRDLFGAELAVAVAEMIHGSCSLINSGIRGRNDSLGGDTEKVELTERSRPPIAYPEGEGGGEGINSLNSFPPRNYLIDLISQAGPTDCARPCRPCSARGCRSWSCSRPCGPAALARCEYRNRLPAGAWRSCDAGYDTTPVCRPQPRPRLASLPAAGAFHPDDDGAPCRNADQPNVGARETRTANPTRGWHSDISSPTQTAKTTPTQTAKKPRQSQHTKPTRATPSSLPDAAATARQPPPATSSRDLYAPCRRARPLGDNRDRHPSPATARIPSAAIPHHITNSPSTTSPHPNAPAPHALPPATTPREGAPVFSRAQNRPATPTADSALPYKGTKWRSGLDSASTPTHPAAPQGGSRIVSPPPSPSALGASCRVIDFTVC